MILGKISAVDDTDGLQLIIDGEDEPTTKKYTYMASYTPEANDRVLIEEIGGSYVIIGKIISDTASSGIARIAQNAEHAASATNATNAETATTATTAATCTGNATTATTATNLAGASTQYGQLVYSVTRTYNYDLREYIVTDVSLTGGNHNYVYK